MSTVRELTRAYHFAALKHVDQRRKGQAAEPYMNHLTEVAELVSVANNGADVDVIVAAVLHDTVEDTDTSFDELEKVFAARVSGLVAEVSDDKSVPKAKRKLLQIQHAAHASEAAKLIKLADKTANLRALASSPPPDWSDKRRAEYVEWAQQVVSGCRGINVWLEGEFDKAVQALEHEGHG